MGDIFTKEDRRIADNAILVINNDKGLYDRVEKYFIESQYVPVKPIRGAIGSNGDLAPRGLDDVKSLFRRYINSVLNSNEGWGYELRYPYPHPIDQFNDEPTKPKEELPMSQLNFKKPVEDLKRVFGVENIASLNEEELISMIREARKYVKGLEDMVNVSKKMKEKCEQIEGGISLLVKALDGE